MYFLRYLSASLHRPEDILLDLRFGTLKPYTCISKFVLQPRRFKQCLYGLSNLLDALKETDLLFM